MLALARRVRELEVRNKALTLENELLGEVNENLRQWLLANTAAAAGIVNGFGATRVRHDK